MLTSVHPPLPVILPNEAKKLKKKLFFTVFNQVLLHLYRHVYSFAHTHNTMFLCHHQIDGQTNPKLQSVFLERFPIHTAHFSSDGEQVILASQRRSFYVYDMIKGEVIKIPEIRGIDDLSYTTIGLVFISQRFLRL